MALGRGCCALAAVFGLASLAAAAQQAGSDWTQFRGPDGLGASADKGLPTTWGPQENVVWKAELPGAGASTPILLGDRIYLTCYSGYAVPGEPQGEMDALKRHLVCLRRTDGKLETRDLAKDDTDEVDEWLQGDAVPDGQWTVVDAATGFGIRSTFDKPQVSQCLLNRSRKDGRVNLELYSKSAQLEPGKSLQLKQSIEVVAEPKK